MRVLCRAWNDLLCEFTYKWAPESALALHATGPSPGTIRLLFRNRAWRNRSLSSLQEHAMPTGPTLAVQGFRFRWTLLTMLGLAVGLAAGLLLGGPIGAVVGMILVTPAVTGIVGAALGTSQWLALRRRLAHARWWIAASAAGLGLGLAAGVTLVEQT